MMMPTAQAGLGNSQNKTWRNLMNDGMGNSVHTGALSACKGGQINKATFTGGQTRGFQESNLFIHHCALHIE